MYKYIYLVVALCLVTLLKGSFTQDTAVFTRTSERCCSPTVTTDYPGLENVEFSSSTIHSEDQSWTVFSGELVNRPKQCKKTGTYTMLGEEYSYGFHDYIFFDGFVTKNSNTPAAVIIIAHMPLENAPASYSTQGSYEYTVIDVIFMCQ
jgi:hypothetical protein